LTDSFLELGTANPFDLDAEKALAFATAREIRLFLLAPSKISEKLDEMYKPEKAIDKLLEGMGDDEVLTTLKDAPPEELNVSEADASQKPVVRLVDMIISTRRTTGFWQIGRATSELQSRVDLVCRLLLDRKNKH